MPTADVLPFSICVGVDSSSRFSFAAWTRAHTLQTHEHKVTDSTGHLATHRLPPAADCFNENVSAVS